MACDKIKTLLRIILSLSELLSVLRRIGLYDADLSENFGGTCVVWSSSIAAIESKLQELLGARVFAKHVVHIAKVFIQIALCLRIGAEIRCLLHAMIEQSNHAEIV